MTEILPQCLKKLANEQLLNLVLYLRQNCMTGKAECFSAPSSDFTQIKNVVNFVHGFNDIM